MTRNRDFDTVTMPEGYIDNLAKFIAGEPLPNGILCAGVRYIPAPTWRPIAEMPAEWKDGRDVIVKRHKYLKFVAHWDADLNAWETWNGDTVEPLGFLDLTIPEVPRG